MTPPTTLSPCPSHRQSQKAINTMLWPLSHRMKAGLVRWDSQFIITDNSCNANLKKKPCSPSHVVMSLGGKKKTPIPFPFFICAQYAEKSIPILSREPLNAFAIPSTHQAVATVVLATTLPSTCCSCCIGGGGWLLLIPTGWRFAFAIASRA